MFIKKFFKLKLVKSNSKIYKTKPSCKLLKFRSKNADILSDADTTSLLLGVINLIKNNAIKKTEFLLNREVEYYKKISIILQLYITCMNCMYVINY